MCVCVCVCNPYLSNVHVCDAVLIQDQLARKERMAVELSHQVEEKGRLEAEVEMMVRELQAREQQRKHNADTNTMVSGGVCVW